METKTTHTPGPWTFTKAHENEDDTDPAYAPFYVEADPFYIAGVAGRDLAEAEDNARLIAAAPELLNALKRLEQAITHPDKAEQFAAVEAARAAILRAEGK